jgi:hypothetical protein
MTAFNFVTKALRVGNAIAAELAKGDLASSATNKHFRLALRGAQRFDAELFSEATVLPG